MMIVRTVAELRAEVAGARAVGSRIGLVPTMGFLHQGHLALVRRARELAGYAVATLFVNPAQFNDPKDLERYPRSEARDAELLAGAGADLLFAPAAETVYPPGFATTVSVAGVTGSLEGAVRGPAHFEGVATVVTKLFIMATPDVACFGQKDAQQVLVVKRLVRDLDLPIAIEVVPTVREPDGLAMSSRNALLTPEDRARAPALWRALSAVGAAVRSGVGDLGRALEAGRAELRLAGVEPEYFEIVDADSLAPPDEERGGLLVLVAARLGSVRLIDNLPIVRLGPPGC